MGSRERLVQRQNRHLGAELRGDRAVAADEPGGPSEPRLRRAARDHGRLLRRLPLRRGRLPARPLARRGADLDDLTRDADGAHVGHHVPERPCPAPPPSRRARRGGGRAGDPVLARVARPADERRLLEQHRPSPRGGDGADLPAVRLVRRLPRRDDADVQRPRRPRPPTRADGAVVARGGVHTGDQRPRLRPRGLAAHSRRRSPLVRHLAEGAGQRPDGRAADQSLCDGREPLAPRTDVAPCRDGARPVLSP